MSTIKPANFPTVNQEIIERIKELKSEVNPGHSGKKASTQHRIFKQETVNTKSLEKSAAESKVSSLRFYHPNKIDLKKSVKLGQFIDIKI
ncbi:MAG: hypothetical protein ACE5HI_04945 [bacterium]